MPSICYPLNTAYPDGGRSGRCPQNLGKVHSPLRRVAPHPAWSASAAATDRRPADLRDATRRLGARSKSAGVSPGGASRSSRRSDGEAGQGTLMASGLSACPGREPLRQWRRGASTVAECGGARRGAGPERGLTQMSGAGKTLRRGRLLFRPPRAHTADDLDEEVERQAGHVST